VAECGGVGLYGRSLGDCVARRTSCPFACGLTKKSTPERAVTPDADLGVLFMHNEGYSTMCGYGIIALMTALLKMGTLQVCVQF
jgi:hypothetical protein